MSPGELENEEYLTPENSRDEGILSFILEISRCRFILD